MKSCLVSKLSKYGSLSKSDISLLEDVERETQNLSAGELLHEQGEAFHYVYVVKSGWIVQSCDLKNGEKQNIRLSNSGDMVGVADLPYSKALSSLSALTEAQVCPFPRKKFQDLLKQSDQLTRIFFTIEMRQQAMLAERIISMGLRTAEKRIAHFFMEMATQQDEIEESYTLPLTQKMIGETLGISEVHVNRAMSSMKKNGCIKITRGRVDLIDIRALKEISEYDNAYLFPNPVHITQNGHQASEHET
jgi:CRP-like cAMP-binding protein